MASNSSTTGDLTEENKKFFNEHAANYESRTAHTTLMQIVGEEVLARKGWSGVAWDENSTRMLDYGCGVGFISTVLAPYTKQVIGMDISEGMVEQFNQKVNNQGIPHEEMRAIVANLCVDEVEPAVSGPEYYNFDVAISTLAFHHFDNVPLSIRRVVERLRPKTGVLLIIDFRTHKPIQFGRHEQHQHHHQHAQEKHHDAQSKPLGFHGGAHTVAHSGFSEEEIKRWYEEAGLVDVEIVDVGPGTGITIFGGGPDTGEANKLRRAVFMAKGRRG